MDRGRLVRSVADQLTAPVINAIRLVAGTVATIAHVVSALVPCAVVVIAAPVPEIEIPPDLGPAVQGFDYAIVSAGDLPDWPDVLADCGRETDRPGRGPGPRGRAASRRTARWSCRSGRSRSASGRRMAVAAT